MGTTILNPALDDVKLLDVVGLDLETSGLTAWEHHIKYIAVASGNTEYIFDVAAYSRPQLDALFDKLAGRTVVGHNLKFDLSFLYYHYNRLFPKIWDTELASRVLTAGLNLKHSLPDVVLRYLHKKFPNKDDKHSMQLSFTKDGPLTQKQLEYMANDVRYLVPLYHTQVGQVRAKGLTNVMLLENKLIPAVVKMEVHGCRIDKELWLKYIDHWTKRRQEYIALLDEEVLALSHTYQLPMRWRKPRKRWQYVQPTLFGGEVVELVESEENLNYASHDQLLKLFEYCKQPAPTLKEDNVYKPSVGRGALETYLAEHCDSPLRRFIELLLGFREYEKLLSTYGHGFLEKLDERGYIHTSYHQCLTVTGRLSSSSPNLQNIPATSLEKDGYDLRRCFLPDEGHTMVTCDMDAAEVRIAAAYSKEPALLDLITSNSDLHSMLASITFSIIFGKPVTIDKSSDTIEVNGHQYRKVDLRNQHKAVLFAKFYKGGPRRCYEILAEYINRFHPKAPHKVAAQISQAIDQALPVLTSYLTGVIEQAQKQGYLVGSRLGRMRYFQGESVYGEAANFPIQNTNAEALKSAIIRVDEYLTETGYGRVVMNIHDELVCSVKEEHAEEAAKQIQRIMAESLEWFLDGLPGGASYKIKPYWTKD